MGQTERVERWYPIEQLSMFETLIAEEIEATEESYANFLQVKDKPHVLDDSTIDRAIRLYTERIEFIDHYERQFARWRAERLTPFQQGRLDALAFKTRYHRNKVEELLSLIKKNSKGTINKIMEMSDLELALKVLSREIKMPK